MIVGIGVDLEQVDRFTPLLKKESFLSRVYTEKERGYILNKRNPSETAAGLYCAKEALSKALGTGLFRVLFQEVEVCHDPNGAPYFRFSGALAHRLQAVRAHVSIAHSGGMAIAHVVLEEPANA